MYFLRIILHKPTRSDLSLFFYQHLFNNLRNGFTRSLLSSIFLYCCHAFTIEHIFFFYITLIIEILQWENLTHENFVYLEIVKVPDKLSNSTRVLLFMNITNKNPLSKSLVNQNCKSLYRKKIYTRK